MNFSLRKRPPAGPSGIQAEGHQSPPPGDGATHEGPRVWDRAPSRQMRAFDDSEQPPVGPVLVDPRHNLYMPSRYAMGWFGGLIPNQPLPDWSLVAQSNTARFHAMDTPIQVRAKTAGRGGPGGAQEKGKGTVFPTAIQNPAQYLRMGGTAPIGIGPMQIQDFHVATDAIHPTRGNGPGSTFANAPFMANGFAAET